MTAPNLMIDPVYGPYAPTLDDPAILALPPRRTWEESRDPSRDRDVLTMLASGEFTIARQHRDMPCPDSSTRRVVGGPEAVAFLVRHGFIDDVPEELLAHLEMLEV